MTVEWEEVTVYYITCDTQVAARCYESSQMYQYYPCDKDSEEFDIAPSGIVTCRACKIHMEDEDG